MGFRLLARFSFLGVIAYAFLVLRLFKPTFNLFRMGLQKRIRVGSDS